MANLSIRKLDDEVFSKLRMIASQHGVSMEEEVRQILTKTVLQQVKLGDLALQLFGNEQGIELELLKHSAHKPMDLLS